MVLKSTFTIIAVAALAIFTATPQTAEAHSWADCVDWKFKKSSDGRAGSTGQDWGDNSGKCNGYARRFPLGKAFGSLDSASPNRHYMQDRKHPSTALPCSNRRAGDEPGSDETRANPVSKAYGGKYGKMTVVKAGGVLCVRWPAKNHAKKDEVKRNVFINWAKISNNKDLSQTALTNANIAKLPYWNCKPGKNEDRRACGGCFAVPKSSPGTYLLQWRWMLNKDKKHGEEWYTSCADVQVTK
ncbi:hypothetical protein BGZ83_000930 [Gryganskiella cystojenkinii]|nr:hypothetical protein BGZ83_000930 [Gryganskiella cystojenkinii]